ncbi:MAG: ABC transporter ATP-binding protein, partial [Bacteroidota bacterium]
MDYLVARKLNKQYGDHIALSDLDISLPRQSIFGLLGPNGAGKTSFIRIVAQIIKADSGSVMIDGEEIGRKHMSMIGYMPEERGLYRKMEVADLLMYFSRLKDVPETEARKRIGRWLKRLDLIHWADSKVDKLSKGMQQKLQFIATVIHEPSL